MHWWESAPCPLLPRALRSRLQRWWLNLRRPRALQTQAGIRLHTQRRKQKLREMPRIPQCPVPACPKILTPHNCIHGGESRSLEKCQESPCAQPVQNSDTSDPFWKQWLSRQQTRPPWSGDTSSHSHQQWIRVPFPSHLQGTVLFFGPSERLHLRSGFLCQRNRKALSVESLAWWPSCHWAAHTKEKAEA
nr:uncharacterized protein LOC127490200 isoform X2 [Oryctolagus cuniculus]XP_051698346.1 uncharacterized protein LOC127490200 isoform X2 [Oryctolagus cuniculus]